MDRKEHYQHMAGECLKLAHTSDNPTNKAVLLQMAQIWANLAEQVRDSEIDVRSPESDDE